MSDNPTGSSLIGKSLRRVEDDRLLRGQGQYLADLSPPGTLHAVFVRSPHAHARIVRIDATAVRALPGVVAVYTAEDVVHRTEPICVSGEVHTPERLQRELKPLDRLHPIPLFPSEKVTYVGHPVAMIVAESRLATLDALELMTVDYENLPAVVDAVAALEPDAPLIEPAWKTNLALSVATGKGNPDEVFATAPIVVADEFRTQRYVASPLETRGILAVVEPFSGSLTIWASTQTPHVLQMILAGTLRMPIERIRVVACDVGGGFGQKGVQSVEDALVPFAARELGRPVRWVEERGENLMAAAHARDQVHRISVAADSEGRILALRDDVIVNFGAYNVIGLVVPYNTLSHLLGPYHVPNAHISVRAALTNTCFTTPYRGAGRPEAVFAMERIIDRLAARLGMEPADVRARNLVPASAMPYDTGLLYRDGNPQVYDSGDFPELLRRARALVDLDGIRARQKRKPAPGEQLLGVGFALYVEGSGMGPFEGAVVRVLPSGRVQVATGACSQGQGHRTVYAQITADALGVPFESIDVIGGDTATIAFGIGTIASRSTVTAGNAIHQASLKVKERALAIASRLMETAVPDLEIVDGQIRTKGIPGRAMPLAKISQAAAMAVLKQGAPGDGLLADTAYFIPSTVTYSSAAHAVVVGIDPDTGVVKLERYVVVHDCGRVVNPLLADAQVVGGIMQGIGGALREELLYDETGQPLTGSFMDYAMPIASDMPPIALDHIESLSTRNPLGVKGLGEGGAIGPPAAIANAVEDALKPYGIVIRRGPLTSARIHRLLAEAKPSRP
ncbi:MAG: xanthine dehydrogenase family protein molybdopterin-binding subunit [Betaproteobacteria bacterium]|nr:xanthine dehydrogenase family protein molybdopterin-binding subunit [Betaproteobacteria bacterium]